MEEMLNKLIKMEAEYKQLSTSKIYTQAFKDDCLDKANALKEAIETLTEFFDVKLCDQCGSAYEPEFRDDCRCGGCEQHYLAKLETQWILDNNR